MFKTIEESRLDLVSSSGDDFMPCRAARVSFGNEDKTGKSVENDKKLMKYLADHEHMSPFEHQSATFLVEVPLFIRSQIMRHRTFAYNEISRRYTDENLEFWIPTTFRKQSDSNRQASEGVLDHTNFIAWLGWDKDENDVPQPRGTMNGHDGFVQWRWSCYNAWHDYLAMLESGVSREQARALLPQSLLTKFYMTGKYCPASR